MMNPKTGLDPEAKFLDDGHWLWPILMIVLFLAVVFIGSYVISNSP
jgi:hypothetical protein